MFTIVTGKGRKAFGIVKNRLAPTAAELKLRQQVAFEMLHPQVQAVKTSPTVQIVAGTVISGLFLAGQWGTAAVLAGAWFGAKPLTKVIAGGVGAIGLVDAKLLAALGRFQAMHAEPA